MSAQAEQDVDEKTLKKPYRDMLRALRNYGDSASSGVYLHPHGKEYCAWINYNPPYDENGGSWRAYAADPNTAIGKLYRMIKEFREKKIVN